jgi:LA2681-like HEPN
LTRNHIEHKYLRITATGFPTAPPDDLAFMVPRDQFESKRLHLLKLARTALIYLAVGVKFEEQRRATNYAGSSLEEIPLKPYLPDAEKT